MNKDHKNKVDDNIAWICDTTRSCLLPHSLKVMSEIQANDYRTCTRENKILKSFFSSKYIRNESANGLWF